MCNCIHGAIFRSLRRQRGVTSAVAIYRTDCCVKQRGGGDEAVDKYRGVFEGILDLQTPTHRMRLTSCRLQCKEVHYWQTESTVCPFPSHGRCWMKWDQDKELRTSAGGIFIPPKHKWTGHQTVQCEYAFASLFHFISIIVHTSNELTQKASPAPEK